VYDRAARSTRQTVAELDASLDAEAIVVRGDKLGELRRAMSQQDLLVIGSRGYRPLRGAVSGSLSGRLMRYARGPLLLVPPSARGSAAERTAADRSSSASAATA
jgi:nucleotide-binding universal stress UspA family protein